MIGDVREQLHAMADRLDHDPDEPADLTLTPAGCLALAADVSDGDQAFTDLLPPVTGSTTRGQYASRLRQIAGKR